MPMHPNQAAVYLSAGDQELQRLSRSYLELLAAVEGVYYSAVWTADRQVDELKLWEDLRKAAGIVSKNSPLPTELYVKFQEVKNT